MEIRETTESFLEALRFTYYTNDAKSSTDYLRGESRLLAFLNIDPKSKHTPGRLADELGITTARIASMLKSLEKKGLVTREASPDDKRKVFVGITDDGIEFIEKKRVDVCSYFDEVFTQLTPDERAEFIRLIRKIAKKEKE